MVGQSIPTQLRLASMIVHKVPECRQCTTELQKVKTGRLPPWAPSKRLKEASSIWDLIEGLGLVDWKNRIVQASWGWHIHWPVEPTLLKWHMTSAWPKFCARHVTWSHQHLYIHLSQLWEDFFIIFGPRLYLESSALAIWVKLACSSPLSYSRSNLLLRWFLVSSAKPIKSINPNSKLFPTYT